MIDITFDFTTDSEGYWDGFWEKDDLLGVSGADPDIASKSLQRYHKELWSKELPNGEVMNLEINDDPYYYLTWKDFRFASDSIIVEFRYQKYRYMIEQLRDHVSDYQSYVEDYLRKTYTIGGTIIFPKHTSSMNQNRGRNALISDRWDLTLECIRRYYEGKDSPLHTTIEGDKEFFDLFVDFKGYVDFFFLQDCVSNDYSKVNIWCGDASFEKNGLPETLKDYLTFIDKELDFLQRRNARIKEYADKHLL